MLDSLLFDPATWPIGSLRAASIAALLWGLGSALMSPCHLGIIPLLTSRAAGVSPFDDGKVQTAKRAFLDILLFALGYYSTIPIFGAVIAFLGVGFSDESHLWTIPAGVVLLWFGVSMFRGHSCSNASHLLQQMGKWFGLGPQSGVVALGFGYGILSGGCSAGFLVPIMLISISQGLLICIWLAACFGIGHCLPMIIVGCSAPLAAKYMAHHKHHHDENSDEHHSLCCHHDDPHHTEKIFRTILGIVMLCIGILFILHPFLEHHH